MIRNLDITLSMTGLVVLSPVLILVYCILLLLTRSPLFFQSRIGQNKKQIRIVKFRTLNHHVQDVGSHLLSPSDITTFGHFLRKTKIDEFPQLWNVLKGDMSLVGPRPSLINQEQVIAEREKLNIYSVKPGITGKAQVAGVDMSTPKLLAKLDAEMLVDFGVKDYFTYIIKTVSKATQLN